MSRVKLTDKQKKKIIADYVDNNNYSETARINNISETSVRRIVKGNEGITEKVEQKKDDSFKKVSFFKDEVIKNMDSLREIVDLVETKVDKSLWPLPTYSDLLFDM